MGGESDPNYIFKFGSNQGRRYCTVPYRTAGIFCIVTLAVIETLAFRTGLNTSHIKVISVVPKKNRDFGR